MEAQLFYLEIKEKVEAVNKIGRKPEATNEEQCCTNAQRVEHWAGYSAPGAMCPTAPAMAG